MLLLAACIETGLLLSLAGTWLGALFSWPGHGILDSSVNEAFFGTLALTAIFIAPFFLDFAPRKRTYWRASTTGIDVYDARKQCHQIAWNQITRIDVLPFRITVQWQSGARRSERLYYAPPSDGRYLREMWLRYTLLPS